VSLDLVDFVASNDTASASFSQLGFIEYNGDMKVNYSLMNMVLHETPEIRASTEK
jgi:hypothetical protein